MRSGVATACIAIGMLGSPAQAENWRPSSAAGDAVAFIDVDSIRREGDQVLFWREVRWPTPRTLDGGLRYDRIGELYEASCRNMTLRSTALRVKLGEQVVFSHNAPRDTENATAGSNAETDIRSACFDEWPAATGGSAK